MNDIDELGVGVVEPQVAGHALEVGLGRIETGDAADVAVQLFAGVASRVST